MAPGPLGVMQTELLMAMPPIPSKGPAHIPGSILAGLLRGQVSNQQGMQELADKTEVRVEGVEGILRENRQSGTQTHRQTDRQTAGAAPRGSRQRQGGRAVDGRAEQIDGRRVS